RPGAALRPDHIELTRHDRRRLSRRSTNPGHQPRRPAGIDPPRRPRRPGGGGAGHARALAGSRAPGTDRAHGRVRAYRCEEVRRFVNCKAFALFPHKGWRGKRRADTNENRQLYTNPSCVLLFCSLLAVAAALLSWPAPRALLTFGLPPSGNRLAGFLP